MSRRHPRGGFTLLEILLALAMAATLLIALNLFVFSMGELWGRNSDQRLFDRHVRAVTRFLENTLQETAVPPAGQFGTNPIAPQPVQNAAGETETLLTFVLPAGSRVLTWDGPPLPEVVCSLEARPGTGLVLIWHSQLETAFANNGPGTPRETVLTPLVTAMSYDYYDPTLQTWQNASTLQQAAGGQWEIPVRLRLRFTYGKLTRDAIIPLPQPSQALPLF